MLPIGFATKSRLSSTEHNERSFADVAQASGVIAIGFAAAPNTARRITFAKAFRSLHAPRLARRRVFRSGGRRLGPCRGAAAAFAADDFGLKSHQQRRHCHPCEGSGTV